MRKCKVWTKLISRPSISRRFCPVAPWKTRRRSSMPSLRINYGQDEDEKKKSRRLKNADTREGDCWESTPEKSLEEFGSVDAYNRPSLPSNKMHASISPSKKYRFRATYFGSDAIVRRRKSCLKLQRVILIIRNISWSDLIFFKWASYPDAKFS